MGSAPVHGIPDQLDMRSSDSFHAAITAQDDASDDMPNAQFGQLRNRFSQAPRELSNP